MRLNAGDELLRKLFLAKRMFEKADKEAGSGTIDGDLCTLQAILNKREDALQKYLHRIRLCEKAGKRVHQNFIKI